MIPNQHERQDWIEKRPLILKVLHNKCCAIIITTAPQLGSGHYVSSRPTKLEVCFQFYVQERDWGLSNSITVVNLDTLVLSSTQQNQVTADWKRGHVEFDTGQYTLMVKYFPTQKLHDCHAVHSSCSLKPHIQQPKHNMQKKHRLKVVLRTRRKQLIFVYSYLSQFIN